MRGWFYSLRRPRQTPIDQVGDDGQAVTVHGVAIESYERAIDAHVKNIRRKIEPEPGSPRYVVTVHGVGYRFADA